MDMPFVTFVAILSFVMFPFLRGKALFLTHARTFYVCMYVCVVSP